MKVVYRHYRMFFDYVSLMRYRRGRTEEVPLPRGGMTYCAILDDGGNVVGVGMSLCSMKDNFCYKKGREVARDRAEEGELFVWPEWALEYIPSWLRRPGCAEEGMRLWAEEVGFGEDK